MPTAISDLWVPDVWLQTVREKVATLPNLINSPVIVDSAEATTLATGAGEVGTLPFWKDITDQDDGVQVPGTSPTDQKFASGLMKAVVCNRETKNSIYALASQVAEGSTPEQVIEAHAGAIATRRLKQRQKTLLALLRGAMGSAGASGGGSAALKAMLYDNFVEASGSVTAAQLISAEMFIRGTALMGELAGDLANGAMWVHPNILAALKIADLDAFTKDSQGDYALERYRNIPIFQSEALVRAGTTSGYVYETYILAPGVIAKGEKPQVAGVNLPGVATLTYNPDVDKNLQAIYDRTRFTLHLNGMKWKGTPAAESPTNAELGTAANWDYVFTTGNRAGVVCVRTNG